MASVKIEMAEPNFPADRPPGYSKAENTADNNEYIMSY